MGLMIREGKAWGYTTQIFDSQNVEVHIAEIVKGGYCSIHEHNKNNIFYVISGKLKVRVWVENKLIDETIIKKGESTAAYRGLEHQFEALEKTICVETYNIFLEPGDIKRRPGSQGGVKK
jgi:quercetin dioxygenase-like cupin family protein